MGWHGEFNIGELCRTAYGDEAVLIGFGTDRGTVAAADDWDGEMRDQIGRAGAARQLRIRVPQERAVALADRLAASSALQPARADRGAARIAARTRDRGRLPAADANS